MLLWRGWVVCQGQFSARTVRAQKRLPLKVWYTEDAQANDQRFWPHILGSLKEGALLIFDLGYTNFSMFARLTLAYITSITRAKSNLVYTVERALHCTSAVHDALGWIGQGEDRQMVRLIRALHQGKWYRYLTNELDQTRLPTEYAVAVHWQRWRIEDAYAVLVDLTDAVAAALNQPLAAVSMEMVYRSLYTISLLSITVARQRIWLPSYPPMPNGTAP
jgi:hypothetical protein